MYVMYEYDEIPQFIFGMVYITSSHSDEFCCVSIAPSVPLSLRFFRIIKNKQQQNEQKMDERTIL